MYRIRTGPRRNYNLSSLNMRVDLCLAVRHISISIGWNDDDAGGDD